jgi:hypothetical protein
MGRRDYKSTRRPQQEGQAAKPRKGGGLGTGLFVGLILGMAIAGGMYWYLNSQPSGLKEAEPVPEIAPPKQTPVPPVESAPSPAPEVAPEPAKQSAPKAEAPTPPEPRHDTPEKAKPPETPRKPSAEPTPKAPSGAAKKAAPPAPDYSFYDILPGHATPKPKPVVKPTEQYWLQVAALRAAPDAERLKARLALLSLPVVVQKIDNAGTVLHRVRVGPYKSEDEGLEALDTLAENNFEPRWVKDPVNP